MESAVSNAAAGTGQYLAELTVISGKPMFGLAPANTNPTSTGLYFDYELASQMYTVVHMTMQTIVTLYENGVQKEQQDNITFEAVFACSPLAVNCSVSINWRSTTFLYPPAGYEGLYQTWEYARTALGYALDRIAKLEKRLEDAETIANLRTLIDGALSRIASIESDEVNDDADNSLIIWSVTCHLKHHGYSMNKLKLLCLMSLIAFLLEL